MQMIGMSIEGLNILHVAGNVSYGLLQIDSSVDQLEIDVGNSGNVGFNYFHNKFGMPYSFFLKQSISSGHSLFVALRDKKLLGFARFEKLSDKTEKTHRGKTNIVHHPVHILRSIEIHPAHRKVGIGRLLFAIAVNYLKTTVITMPDNPEAARFFKEKLSFITFSSSDHSFSLRYKKYLILPYPVGKDLIKTIACDYPRVVMPELVGRYEDLKFKNNMGKYISEEDIVQFQLLFEDSLTLLDSKLMDEMTSFIKDFKICNGENQVV